MTGGKSLTPFPQVDRVFNDKSGAEDQARRERVAKQIGLDKIARAVSHGENHGGANPIGDAEKANGAPNGRLAREADAQPEMPTGASA